ncbi:MAG: FAD-dependent oxidoreductase [Planctomycetota bacterium]
MSERHVLIVGAGIIGTCSAYYLRKQGWEVTMIDPNRCGSQCSHGNCGLISPSHALPLAVPGAVAKTLPMMLKKSAPLHVKPRFDPDLWGWLLKFAMRCKEAPMLEAAAGRHALLQSSLSAYHDMIQAEGIDCEWEDRGALFVYQTPSGMDSYIKTDKWLQQFGLGAERLNGEQLVEKEPALKPGVAAGAWFYKVDAHLRPDKLIEGLRLVLERLGVTIKEGVRFEGFAAEGNGAAAANTSEGNIAASHFLIATGAWTPKLNQWVGAKVPIQPGKGYSITMPRPGVCPSIPMVFQEQKVCVTPFTSGYRIGSTMEFAGYNTTINRTRLESLKKAAAIYLHEPTRDPVEEEWYGWRPMTYDGKPVIDQSPRYDNVFLAAGHNMLGLSMGSGTGKLVAEMMSEQSPHIDLQHYALSRF